MNLIDFESTCVFNWVNNCTLRSIDTVVDESKKSNRIFKICYAGTQYRRIYVVAQRGKLRFEPYELHENCWRQLYPHLVKVTELRPEHLASEGALKDVLSWQLCLQYPLGIIGYYDEPLSHKQVLSTLKEGDTVERLNELKYSHFPENVQTDAEWDAAISIPCEGGILVIPYRGLEQELILKYATFIPESVTYTVTSKFSRIVDSVASAFGNLHWSSLRDRINKIGGM